jgi:thioredoxin 1
MKEIFYFSAPWCQPCRTLGPIMESISDKITYTKIDVDQDTELAAKYKIRNIPTLVLVVNGIEKKRLTGLQTANNIISFYNG